MELDVSQIQLPDHANHHHCKSKNINVMKKIGIKPKS